MTTCSMYEVRRNHWKHKFYAIRRFQPGRWEGGLIGITSRSLEIHEKLFSSSDRPLEAVKVKQRTEREYAELDLARGIKLNMGKRAEEGRYKNTEARGIPRTSQTVQFCQYLSKFL